VVARQEEMDGRAEALLALDLDVAARLLDEAIDHRQAKARALPQRLGRKEGIEDLAQHIGRHAHARVGDADLDIVAGLGAVAVGQRSADRC
jgi:hypothetical protein